MNIILATASPFRNAFFKQLNLEYETLPTCIDENPFKEQYKDKQLAIKLAEAKADSLKHKENAIIIAMDTINIRNNEIHHKPKTYEEAFNSIKAISNTIEHVHTGVCMINTATKEKYLDCADMIISFMEFKDEEINSYLETLKDFKASCAFEPTSFFAMKHHKKVEGSTSHLINGIPFELVLPKLREWGVNI